jgi:NAD(P)H-hydrate repair Nnr-like enzyme with NAD(P)H-hydrate epimerase domain
LSLLRGDFTPPVEEALDDTVLKEVRLFVPVAAAAEEEDVVVVVCSGENGGDTKGGVTATLLSAVLAALF